MAHTYNWKSDGLIRKFTGEISAVEILKSNFDLHQSDEFKSIKYIINDFTAVTGYAIDKPVTKIYASTDDIISDTKGYFKIAIVAVEPGHIELAENYRKEMKNKYFKCEIFPNAGDALVWAEQ